MYKLVTCSSLILTKSCQTKSCNLNLIKGVRNISRNAPLKGACKPSTSPCGSAIKEKPKFATIPKHRAGYDKPHFGDRFVNYMFKKDVIMHHFGLIPIIVLATGGLSLLFLVMVRNLLTRSDVKWTPRSKFAYEKYDLNNPKPYQNHIFVYHQKYKPNPDLKKLYKEIEDAKKEQNES